jgi:hypothetical protein
MKYLPPDPESWRKRQVCSKATNDRSATSCIQLYTRGSGGYTAFKGISLHLLNLSGSPHADRARCQLANPTTHRRQGVAEAARWGFHCGREGHRGLPGSFLRAAPEPFLTDFGVRGHLARLGARLAQPPDRHRATPTPRRGAPVVCPRTADTLSREAGGPGPAGGPVMPP